MAHKFDLNETKQRVEHIIGNVKGGVKSPQQAVDEIYTIYVEAINKIRYPGEPSLMVSQLTPEDIERENYFNQTDKSKQDEKE